MTERSPMDTDTPKDAAATERWPEDIQALRDHEPRFVDIDRAERGSSGEVWWRGLVDTTGCHRPSEIASSLREKGHPQAEPGPGVVWLRPVRPGEPDERRKAD